MGLLLTFSISCQKCNGCNRCNEGSYCFEFHVFSFNFLDYSNTFSHFPSYILCNPSHPMFDPHFITPFPYREFRKFLCNTRKPIYERLYPVCNHKEQPDENCDNSDHYLYCILMFHFAPHFFILTDYLILLTKTIFAPSRMFLEELVDGHSRTYVLYETG